MKSHFRFRCFAALLLSAAVAFGAAKVAKDPKETPPKVKPDLHLDPAPIGDGKGGAVTSYADIVEPVQKAVVSIYSTKIIKERYQINPFFRQFFPGLQDQERESKEEGLGSGVIVTSDGYILTNNHVVEGADELKVSLSDDREFVGKVIGTDPKTDIAVVKIEAEKLPFVTLADSDKLRVGDVVFAVGNPLNVGQTVTMGIVSAKKRHVGLLDNERGYEDYIQTDAAINMGNSGGALVDARGRLVGINSGILSPTRVNIGIGFAVPVNLAASVMNSLVVTGSVARGTLGVHVDQNPLTPDVAEQLGLPKEVKGVLVTDVVAHSAAAKAGLQQLDVIVAINDRPVGTSDELHFMLGQLIPGAAAKLKIYRDGKVLVLDATLDQSDNPNELLAGVQAEPLDSSNRRRVGVVDPRITSGLVITEVASDSAYRDGLVPNMVVTAINRTAVSDVASAKALLRPGGNLLVIYYHGQITVITAFVPTR